MMATKNPELEKLTKAKLIERLQQEMHRANTLEHEKERVKEEYNVAATSHADTMGRLEKAVKECEALKVGVKERERDINRLEGDLVDRIREAKDWKNAFLEEQRGKRKANTLLVQQAHVAGEISRLVSVADINKN